MRSQPHDVLERTGSIIMLSPAVATPEHVPDALVYDFDHYSDPGLIADAPARIAELVRDAPPAFWTPRHGGHWMLCSHAAVYQASRDSETFKEIERVTIGSTAPQWSERECAVLQAAEELRADAMVGDSAWEKLSRYFDDHQRVELLSLIGQFTKLVYFQNTLRLRLEPYNVGLSAR